MRLSCLGHLPSQMVFGAWQFWNITQSLSRKGTQEKSVHCRSDGACALHSTTLRICSHGSGWTSKATIGHRSHGCYYQHLQKRKSNVLSNSMLWYHSWNIPRTWRQFRIVDRSMVVKDFRQTDYETKSLHQNRDSGFAPFQPIRRKNQMYFLDSLIISQFNRQCGVLYISISINLH